MMPVAFDVVDAQQGRGAGIVQPRTGRLGGCRTVAEIHAQRAALKDKPVAVHGKVVKYMANVMGKNWLHVRDGSGTEAGKNNDLTVTTADDAAVGDVVTVRGAVHLDRDFGAGYAYGVIVEDAKLERSAAK